MSKLNKSTFDKIVTATEEFVNKQRGKWGEDEWRDLLSILKQLKLLAKTPHIVQIYLGNDITFDGFACLWIEFIGERSKHLTPRTDDGRVPEKAVRWL